MSISKGNSNPADLNALFQSAQQAGDLSAQGARVIQIVDVGAQIQAGLGIKPDDVHASEVVLVTSLIDDSGSIRFASNAQLVRDGHNLIVDSLSGSKQSTGVLMHTRYLNGTVLYQYCTLPQVVRMDRHNYDPIGATPLYDQTAVVLGTVLAKKQEFEDAGTPTRTITVIVTDGHDEGSRGLRTPEEVQPLVKDLLAKSEQNIICAMGIDDGGTTDFRDIFSRMGILDRWIITPQNSPSEIRKAFQVISQSAVRASQGGGSFSQTALGGFGQP